MFFESVTLLTCFRDIFGSDLVSVTDYPEFRRGLSQSFQANNKLDHDQFLPNPIQFIIYYNLIMVWVTDSVNKYITINSESR
jgi:hypothetical protein